MDDKYVVMWNYVKIPISSKLLLSLYKHLSENNNVCISIKIFELKLYSFFLFFQNILIHVTNIKNNAICDNSNTISTVTQ